MSDVNSTVASRLEQVRQVNAAPAWPTLTPNHFVLQDERPGYLEQVDLRDVDPFLRGLLFTDGTVTRALEVHALSRVSVSVVSQSTSTVRGQVAAHLRAPVGAESIRRRVVISAGTPLMPIIWAESHMLTNRLPAGFLSVLHDAPDGIGESLQQVRLESWRDLLWFGLGALPAWTSNTDSQTTAAALTRRYRVIADGKPALLISESFGVKRRAGTYHLNWLT